MSKQMYSTPAEYYYPLHQARPRFKNDVENVLIFVASEISKLPEMDSTEFAKHLESAIRVYPGNSNSTDKTISNWRTEISALFALVVTDHEAKTSRPGEMAVLLADQQDLIQFFRYFLSRFQYPGGYLKQQEALEMINHSIKFKPAQFILKMLVAGNSKNQDKRFGFSKAELTHCVFNDLRFTSKSAAPEEAVALITSNRQNDYEYDHSGDVIRSAGDILDYLVLADLLDYMPDNKYYLKRSAREVAEVFIRDDGWFNGYDSFYGKVGVQASDVAKASEAWFAYANNNLNPEVFEANIAEFIESEAEDTKSEFLLDVLKRIRGNIDAGEATRTKEIGDAGEAIVFQHEINRVKGFNREDLLTLIKQIPSHFAVGYDIQSVEEDATRRFIEVKTTISRNKISVNRFHLTPSEWSAAESHSSRYFVYRLLISSNEIVLLIIQDPVGLYKSNALGMLPSGGAEVSYRDGVGVLTDILV